MSKETHIDTKHTLEISNFELLSLKFELENLQKKVNRGDYPHQKSSVFVTGSNNNVQINNIIDQPPP